MILYEESIHKYLMEVKSIFQKKTGLNNVNL